MVLIKALERYKKPSEIGIYINDTFVVNAIRNELTKWQQTDFKKTSGKEVGNAKEWRRLSELIKQHKVTVSDTEHSFTKWMEGEI